ncbi:D-alanine--D-alanine ligase B [Alicyclobacillus hesperidum]|uniref:D-alanine--D-alanine ligase n=2 Tax=Alicyclobacillus hesperidum TaxID=89784 RepID=A0AA37TWK6_9BACL|nr:D-alanine--D-alanine ligase B [Alicyclobacillus hesperidum]
MSGKRMKVGVIFGGKSGEHEVSLQSAKSVMDALDPLQYTIIPIGITRDGRWQVGKGAMKALETAQVAAVESKGTTTQLPKNYINSTIGGLTPASATRSVDLLPPALVNEIDVAIPVLHGTYGEDGSIQGLLELIGVPYVGAGILASAVGLDKIAMKQMFAAVGIPQVQYVACTRNQWRTNPEELLDMVEGNLAYPCFVKPANLGSSVGISKAKTREELAKAIALAAQYDRKIIVEQGLDVREVEVAVLGNDVPMVSVAGEIIPSNEFYDYEAKYVGGNSKLIIPADLTDEQREQVERYAVEAFQAIDCSGLARVDFFIERASGRVLVNEINTMPGFTRYSMYPKLWEATGMSYSKLLDHLIQLALERHVEREQTIHTYEKRDETR